MLALLAALSFAEPPAQVPRALVASAPAQVDGAALDAEFAPMRRRMDEVKASGKVSHVTAPQGPDTLPEEIQKQLGFYFAPGLLHPERLALAPGETPQPGIDRGDMVMPMGRRSDYRVRYASEKSSEIDSIYYVRTLLNVYGRGATLIVSEVLVSYEKGEIRVFTRKDQSLDNGPGTLETLFVLRRDEAGNVVGATIKRLDQDQEGREDSGARDAFGDPSDSVKPPAPPIIVKSGTVTSIS